MFEKTLLGKKMPFTLVRSQPFITDEDLDVAVPDRNL
jgi:hypothetical protein